MHIIIHLDSLSRGGAERVTINLARYLIGHGYSCSIVTERTGKFEYGIPKGVKRFSLDIIGNKYTGYLKNIIKLRNIYNNIDADILLVMDTPGCLLSIPASRGLDMKVIVSERNDPTHFPGKKIVIMIARLLMRFADGYVFQTEEARHFYESITGGRGIVIANPIFVSDIPAPWHGKRRKEIVTAGRLAHQKNQRMLIEVFARVQKDYPDWTLVVYGEGELRRELEELRANLHLEDCVYLPGNQADLLNRINGSSIFVLPSDFEGMPNALLEAMSLGLACIATDCPIGGARAIIQSGVNGILIGVRDYSGLESALRELMSDENKSTAFGNAARSVKCQFDSDEICGKWKEYFELIMQRRFD